MTVEERWQERLTEARVQIGSGLEPELLAERYDAETEEEIEQLTTQATKEMIRGDHTVLVLDDLDVAAEKLEGAGDYEVATDGGVDQSSSDSYQWIECASCGNLYPVGGQSRTDPAETSPENAEHHEQNCPIRSELESRGQTADRDVDTATDRNRGGSP